MASEISMIKSTGDITKDWLESVLNFPSKMGISVDSLSVEQCGSERGALSTMYKVSSLCSVSESNKIEHDVEYHVIVKCNPFQGFFNELGERSHCFEREVWFYGTHLHNLHLFIRTNCSKGEWPILALPKYYYASRHMENNDTILVMEDITKIGFFPIDTPSLSFAQLSVVMETLATFHAVNLCYQQTLGLREVCSLEPDFWAVCHTKELEGDPFDVKVINEFVKPCGDLLCGIIQEVYANEKPSPWVKKAVARVKDIYQNVTYHMETLLKPTTTTSTLIHADPTWRNLMFSETNSVYLIDFQYARQSPVTIDLLHFIFTSCSRSTRRHCTKKLLEIYYNKFQYVVAQFGFDVIRDFQFPFETLYSEYQEHLLWGFISGNNIRQVHCTPLPEDFQSGRLSLTELMEFKLKSLSAENKRELAGFVEDLEDFELL